jgi:hypothetical protein
MERAAFRGLCVPMMRQGRGVFAISLTSAAAKENRNGSRRTLLTNYGLTHHGARELHEGGRCRSKVHLSE